jgi:hypothetical protein
MTARHRSFSSVFYPESVPENWRQIIEEWHVPALVILHDRDVDENGELKKAHYHALLMFSSMKSLTQVHAMTDQLGSKQVEPSFDMRASARYLLHLDQPTKFRYPFDALESFSGACGPDLTAPVGDPTPEILQFVLDNGMTEYSTLVVYCLHHQPEWLKEVKGHTMFWCGYFMSERYKRHAGSQGESDRGEDQ